MALKIKPSKNLIIIIAGNGILKKVKKRETAHPKLEAKNTFIYFILSRKLNRLKKRIIQFITILSNIASSI